MRLGNLSGTKETLVNPIITLDRGDRINLNSKALQKLDLAEGDRVDFDETSDGSLWISKCASKEDKSTMGRSISKTGKFIHNAIHSYLADTPFGEATQWEVQDETRDFDDLVWNKLSIFNTPKTEETVVEEAVVEEVAVVEEQEVVAEDLPSIDEQAVSGIDELSTEEQETLLRPIATSENNVDNF